MPAAAILSAGVCRLGCPACFVVAAVAAPFGSPPASGARAPAALGKMPSSAHRAVTVQTKVSGTHPEHPRPPGKISAAPSSPLRLPSVTTDPPRKAADAMRAVLTVIKAVESGHGPSHSSLPGGLPDFVSIILQRQ